MFSGRFRLRRRPASRASTASTKSILYIEQAFDEEVKRLTGGNGVDVVYDSVGKTTFDKSLNSLRPRGMMALFGQSSGPVPPFDPEHPERQGVAVPHASQPRALRPDSRRTALARRRRAEMGCRGQAEAAHRPSVSALADAAVRTSRPGRTENRGQTAADRGGPTVGLMNLQAKLTLGYVLLAVADRQHYLRPGPGQRMCSSSSSATLERAEILNPVATKFVKRTLNSQLTVPLREALREQGLAADLLDLVTKTRRILEIAVVDPMTNEVFADSDFADRPDRKGRIPISRTGEAARDRGKK